MLFSSSSIRFKYSTSRPVSPLLKGKSPFSPDAEHLHHKLLKAGLSHNKTVMTLLAVAISAGVVAAYIAGAIKIYLVAVAIVSVALLVVSLLSKLRK